MTGDRNASLLAAADALMNEHLDEFADDDGYEVGWRDSRYGVKVRDAIYDALASSSASGAERMRERAIIASIAACAEISAHFDEAEFPTQSAGNFVLDGIEEAETAVVQAIRALPLPEPASVPAWRPKVKALEWRDHSFEESFLLIAPAAFEDYRIVRDPSCDWPFILRPFVAGQSNFQTIEDAMAAAQADYEARILSALDVPEPVPAWRDVATAPKDGTHVILWTTFRVGESSYGICSRQEDGYRANAGEPCWRSASDTYCFPGTPLGWQPLPPPPQADGGSDDA